VSETEQPATFSSIVVNGVAIAVIVYATILVFFGQLIASASYTLPLGPFVLDFSPVDIQLQVAAGLLLVFAAIGVLVRDDRFVPYYTFALVAVLVGGSTASFENGRLSIIIITITYGYFLAARMHLAFARPSRKQQVIHWGAAFAIPACIVLVFLPSSPSYDYFAGLDTSSEQSHMNTPYGCRFTFPAELDSAPILHSMGSERRDEMMISTPDGAVFVSATNSTYLSRFNISTLEEVASFFAARNNYSGQLRMTTLGGYPAYEFDRVSSNSPLVTFWHEQSHIVEGTIIITEPSADVFFLFFYSTDSEDAQELLARSMFVCW
jgi:hypothetical protein